MLVLSRKLNETILIGDSVRVTLLGIEGDKIKIGVDAPRDVKIFREELVEATKNTNQQALAAPIVSFDLSKIKKQPPAKKTKDTTDKLSATVKKAARKIASEKSEAEAVKEEKSKTAKTAKTAKAAKPPNNAK